MSQPSTTTTDFEKLKTALSSLFTITSIDDILSTFGLKTLPTAQRYGIFFGCITFFFTITTVLILLVWGGSFRRMKDQAATDGSATIPDPVTARKGRPLLLERLLDAREWMMRSYDEEEKKKKGKEKFTVLTRRLMNVAVVSELVGSVPDLVDDDDDDKKSKDGKQEKEKEKKKQEIRRHIPEGYEENYVKAYRVCQDNPGGPVLSGLPEARLEAYARAYAGCGTHTTPDYRRSYARMYESLSCNTHSSEQKYTKLFHTRPEDLIGRTVRLEPLEIDRHARVVFDITSSKAYLENKGYDPDEVWGFLEYGPFETLDDLTNSGVFVRQKNEAAFAIVENVTDRVCGVALLTHDDPQNLSVQLEPPIVKPTTEGTVEQIEACFLLLDKLFALGYRRIQLAVDSQDVKAKKLPGRLGFTQEGLLPKHRIMKEANRDSVIYGMLNSDWDKGARAFLFKKLHGSKAQRVDARNNAKEGEKDEWMRVLKEKEKEKGKDGKKENK